VARSGQRQKQIPFSRANCKKNVAPGFLAELRIKNDKHIRVIRVIRAVRGLLLPRIARITPMTRMESDLNLPRRYAFGVEILNEAIFAIGSPSFIFHFSFRL